MDTTDIQGKIRKLMEAVGWSEYRLALKAGLPQSTISHLFNRNNAPNFSTVASICKAFNITLSQFFADDGESVVLSEEQQTHMLIWGALSEKQRQIISDTMDEFIKE